MVILAALLALAGPAGAAAPAIPTRTCEQRIEAGDAPLPFPVRGRGRIFAGPFALAGYFPATPAALGPRGENGRFSAKVGAFVRAGRPVVLSVPLSYRSTFFVHYAQTRAAGAAVRIEPCPPSTPAFSYEGTVGPVTGFSGGFEVTRPGCYPLDVRVEGGRSYRVRVALGRACR